MSRITNMLFTLNCVLQICDFGLAKWKEFAATQTATETRRGTAAYMAPEVLKDAGVSRTTAYDVYAFGVVLWELFTEQKAFDNGTDFKLKYNLKQICKAPDAMLFKTNSVDINTSTAIGFYPAVQIVMRYHNL